MYKYHLMLMYILSIVFCYYGQEYVFGSEFNYEYKNIQTGELVSTFDMVELLQLQTFNSSARRDVQSC